MLSNAFNERLNQIADNTSKQGITHAGTCTTAFTTNEFDAVRVRQDFNDSLFYAVIKIVMPFQYEASKLP